MANTNASSSAHTSDGPSAIAFNLSAIALVAALLGLGLVYAIDMLRLATPTGPQLDTHSDIIDKTIAGQRLAIPSEWFRFEDQKTVGFSEKIDLVFALPLGENGAQFYVDVTLMPRSQVRPSDRLLDSVYLHLFEQNQIDGPVGLVGKPLKPIEGFQHETVWYDPVSQQPFVAKCTPLIEDTTRSSCMRTILVADEVAVTYVFDAEVLNHWRGFDSEAQRWLSRIGGI